MALHMIEGELPEGCEELRQDVAMIAESARSLRKMLRVLSDYNSITSRRLQTTPHVFDPRRLAADVADEAAGGSDRISSRVHLEIEPGAPAEVELDLTQARLALMHAISNAIEAAGGAEVRVQLDGEGASWVTRIAAEQPPAESVQEGVLRADQPQRLVGNALERRGLELSIVAQVSESFGGSARLDLEPGLRSTLVLDWPTRLPSRAGEEGQSPSFARSYHEDVRR
jgi:light-regulated signal transduction histidine kinase (bacteriophytochrome)